MLHGSAQLSADPRPTSHNHEQHLRDALDYQAITGHTGGREAWLGSRSNSTSCCPSPRSALHWPPGSTDTRELRSHVLESKTARTDGIGGGLRRVTAPPGLGVGDDDLRRLVPRRNTARRATGRAGSTAAPHRCGGPRTASRRSGGSRSRCSSPATIPLLDGYSLVSVGARAARALPGRSGRGRPSRSRCPTPELSPAHTVGSYIDYSGIEREEADRADADHRRVRAWAAFADGMPRYPRLP